MSNGLARNPRAPTEAARCGFPSAEMTTIGIRARRPGAEHLREGDAVHDRHHEVEQDDGGLLLRHALQRLLPVAGAGDAVVLALEDVADRIEDVGVVVDDQHERPTAHSREAAH